MVFQMGRIQGDTYVSPWSNPKRVDGMDLFLSRVTTMICIPQSRGKTFLQAID